MKFDEIESTWGLQQPAPAAPADLEALRGKLTAKLDQRRRLLVIAIGTSALGLVAMQAVSIANLYALRQSPPWTFAVHLLLNQGVSLALLFELVRAIIRHRRLAGGRADTVRAVLELSLRNVAEEIRDFRFARWVIPALAFTALLSAYLNNPVALVGWVPFVKRAAIILAVFSLIMRLVWHHYRQRLQPERERLQATLAEMKTGD